MNAEEKVITKRVYELKKGDVFRFHYCDPWKMAWDELGGRLIFVFFNSGNRDSVGSKSKQLVHLKTDNIPTRIYYKKERVKAVYTNKSPMGIAGDENILP
jgi:hypothetical protein